MYFPLRSFVIVWKKGNIRDVLESLSHKQHEIILLSRPQRRI